MKKDVENTEKDIEIKILESYEFKIAELELLVILMIKEID